MAAEFLLRVLAADHVFYEGSCVSVTLPTPDGEVGILANHAEMVTALVPGVLRCRSREGEEPLIGAVGSGFAHVINNQVLVLVDTAERPEEIDENRARRAYEESLEALRQQRGMEEYILAQTSMARAMNRLKVKRGQR